MSLEPECKPFDYPEAPWNRCCPPGYQRKPEQPQAVLPLPSAAPAPSSSSSCCCGTPARAPQATYGGTFYPWFPAGVAVVVPPEKATPSNQEKLDKTQVVDMMELFTGPNGPPPTADIIKMVKSWCETEAGRKAVCGVLREQLQCGGDPALRAMHFVQAVPPASLGCLVDALNAFIKDTSHPYDYALIAAQYRDSAPCGGGNTEKGKYRWEQFQTFVGNPRCEWRPAPEEIGKPLPCVEELKAPEGWQWAMFNRTVLDIHAYCQNGYEWPSK